MAATRDIPQATRRDLYIGAAATFVSAIAFFLVYGLTQAWFDAIQRWVWFQLGIWMWHNPFQVLPYFGGLVGGFVAVFVTEENIWENRITLALKAGFYGFLALLVVVVVFNLVTSSHFPPPVVAIFGILMTYSVLYAPLYVIGAAFGGVVAHLLQI
ncbi:MAG: hypothetical protein ABEJ04_00620 [Halobacteriaceae archaeon]